jgi:hypothetical protein
VRELGERSREPMSRINVGGKFVVAAANILHKGVADTVTRTERNCLIPRIDRSRAFNGP